jgi:hypothetical protein
MAIKKPKKNSTTWHISPPPELLNTVRAWAQRETRTIRNMVVVLLQEAIAVRNGPK